APAAITSTTIPIASIGLRPNARRSSPPTPSLSNSRGSTATARSGTFSCPQVCNSGRIGHRETLNLRRDTADARLFAVDRQPHRYRRARRHTAFDVERAAVKRDEPFHDREAKSRPIVRPVVGGSRLKEGIANMRQIILADA